MQNILDHALNHSGDGEKFGAKFVELVKKAGTAISAYDAKKGSAGKADSRGNMDYGVKKNRLMNDDYKKLLMNMLQEDDSYVNECGLQPFI